MVITERNNSTCGVVDFGTFIFQPDSQYEIKAFTKSGFGAKFSCDLNKNKSEVVTLLQITMKE